MRKLYVGNLSFSTDEGDLKNHFEQIGTVNSVNIIKDRETDRSKGFGFVEMESDDLAHQAIDNLNGKDFLGRPLRIAEANPPKRNNNRSSYGRDN